jgi:hypothetical protein
MTGRVHKPAPPPPRAEPEEAETAPAAVPVVLKRREDAPDLSGEFRKALTRIATGRLCGCHGDHDDTVNDCPRTIARRALEGR